MKIEKLVGSELIDVYDTLIEAKQLFPLYPTHSEAQKALVSAVRKEQQLCYCVKKNKQLVAFLSFKENQLTNFLWKEIPAVRWQDCFLWIEQICKHQFKKAVTIKFICPIDFHTQEVAEKLGYVCVLNKELQKEFSYHTALVLGGGGARGAYQIGVWQALKEREIPIKIITGTSVGALNGGLILQNDYEEAKQMWAKIDTQKILAFPMKEAPVESFSDLLNQVGALTFSALQTRGVSTKPLQQLIAETFSEEKMSQATNDFYLVTTELPSFKETVIHFNECPIDQWQQWLLASASFFPAMEAAQIGEHYYVDGGYRNNIPLDVALAQGATECIIVDVKGPGVTKPVKVPQEVCQMKLQTPWSMGNVLLFDGERSTQNMALGYLETMRMLGQYVGHWYTFEKPTLAEKQFQKAFFRYLEEHYQIKINDARKKITRKLRTVYKDRVYFETISQVLLELLAKNHDISATKLYTLTELKDLLKESWQDKTVIPSITGMISIQEWLKKYYDEYFLLSEKQQLTLMTNFLTVATAERQKRVAFLYERLPVQVLQLLMKEFIEQGVD